MNEKLQGILVMCFLGSYLVIYALSFFRGEKYWNDVYNREYYFHPFHKGKRLCDILCTIISPLILIIILVMMGLAIAAFFRETITVNSIIYSILGTIILPLQYLITVYFRWHYVYNYEKITNKKKYVLLTTVFSVLSTLIIISAMFTTYYVASLSGAETFTIILLVIHLLNIIPLIWTHYLKENDTRNIKEDIREDLYK